MTLTTIKNDIKAFGKKKLEYMRGYIAMQEDFQDKLQKTIDRESVCRARTFEI
ncbi:TPA: hypothetical protein U1X39_000614 [Streptococcus suis]|nr:hypothetical protein [Streptococcus suis]HEM4250822.1 hypothetical protein [Streptococcus suis]